MLGLLFIYFVGRKFYELANEYNKSRWGFAILGVVSYYAGLLIGGILIGIIFEIVSPGYVETINDMILGLMALPIGILACWGTYKLLERSWSKPKEIGTETLDSGLINTEPNRYNQEER